jgi:hypothetical protein
VERGELPVAARVGAALRRGGGLLIGHGGARDAWTAWMAPAGSDGCQAGGAALMAVATSQKGKREGVTGGRRVTPGRRHAGPTWRRPGAGVVGGRRAGVSWAAVGWKGKKRGCRGVQEKEKEVA